jgi:hypothetical protein
VSWNAPRDQRRDGEQKNYDVCYSFYEKSSNPGCRRLNSSNQLILNGLNSARKYFVTVSTVTYEGGRRLTGPKSVEVSQITNGGKYKYESR